MDVVVGSEGDIKPAIEIHEMLCIVDVVVGSEGRHQACHRDS